MPSVPDITNNINLNNFDLVTWYNVLNNRTDKLQIDKHYIKRSLHAVFDMTLDIFSHYARECLFIYYFTTFRVMNLSFKDYANIIIPSDASNNYMDSIQDLNDQILSEMTHKVRSWVDSL